MTAKMKSKMSAKTLVQAWLEVELEQANRSLADTLRDLNKSLDSAHTHSRVREWQESRNGRGERLPRDVRVYMAKRAIKSILEDAGVNTSKLTTRVLNKIAERLS